MIYNFGEVGAVIKFKYSVSRLSGSLCHKPGPTNPSADTRQPPQSSFARFNFRDINCGIASLLS